METSAVGTAKYMSPEVLYILLFGNKSGSFNKEKADIFSIGLTFLRLTLSLTES